MINSIIHKIKKQHSEYMCTTLHTYMYIYMAVVSHNDQPRRTPCSVGWGPDAGGGSR